MGYPLVVVGLSHARGARLRLDLTIPSIPETA